MNKINRYEQAIEALVELRSEILAQEQTDSRATAQLEMVLANHAPLPKDALFLGQADDGLPVLLNLLDPAPGPLLIQGDSGSGKTEFIRAVAAGIELCHDEKMVQYGVVTARPHEWDDLPPSPHRIGIFSAHERVCCDFIMSLNTWAHSNRSDQSVILFWDGLDVVNQLDMEMVDNFRWMLLRGPAKKVWPIVTLNTSRAHGLNSWDGYFRTAFNGVIESPEYNLVKVNSPYPFQANRIGAHSFTMQAGNEQVEIWMPAVGNAALGNMFRLSAG